MSSRPSPEVRLDHPVAGISRHQTSGDRSAWQDVEESKEIQVEVPAAIRTRMSQHRLLDPTPDHSELGHMIESAAHAPDHGRLHPWRFITVRGHAREALGQCFAVDSGTKSPEQVAQLPLRAPLLVTIVFRPRGNTIPGWEQLVATAGVVNNLMLLLHNGGYGSIWKTGKHVSSPSARAMLDVHKDESLLGWLYVGTPDPTTVSRRAELPSLDEHLSDFQPTTCLAQARGH
ncbi:nitroreductase family protein [Actinopolyspora alba]|uniref:nitroreductase family protein n=1 Tax=Actinopolyspora alba TaxID=673379 RepID=UPI000B8508F1